MGIAEFRRSSSLTIEKRRGFVSFSSTSWAGITIEEPRFVESGPLLGSVVVASPADGPPFTYLVEVYTRMADGEYSRTLRYRGRTGYGDGNSLAVIDSEMPETLRRMGLWKTGDALPVPPSLPAGCMRLVLRGGVEWCEPH